jgi:GT2 family glycosyltransferase
MWTFIIVFFTNELGLLVINQKTEPRIHVIIPHNGGKDLLNGCIQSITESSYSNLNIVVIDNGSTDGSTQSVKNRFTDIELVTNKQNMGFAKAVNQGILHALRKGCDYVFLLNNDTILHPDCLEHLINSVHYDDSPDLVGAVGPKILNFGSERKIWFMGARIDLYRGIWQSTQEDAERVTEVDILSGCAVLISSDIFDKIGMFDEDFYTYIEDLDFFIRLNKSDFRIIVNPNAIVWHKAGATAGSGDTPFKIYYTTRNRLLLMRKHARFIHWCYFIPFFIYHLIRRIYLLFISGEIHKSRFLYRAIFDFLSSRFGKQLLKENASIP